MSKEFKVAKEITPAPMEADIKSPYNLEISFGGKDCILICQNVQRTLLNRFKYWMLCRFFPFKIERWVRDNEGE